MHRHKAQEVHETKKKPLIYIFVLLSIFPVCSRHWLVRNVFNDLSPAPSLRPWRHLNMQPSDLDAVAAGPKRERHLLNACDDCWWLLILCSTKVGGASWRFVREMGAHTQRQSVCRILSVSLRWDWEGRQRGVAGSSLLSEHACCGGNSHNTHTHTPKHWG